MPESNLLDMVKKTSLLAILNYFHLKCSLLATSSCVLNYKNDWSVVLPRSGTSVWDGHTMHMELLFSRLSRLDDLPLSHYVPVAIGHSVPDCKKY